MSPPFRTCDGIARLNGQGAISTFKTQHRFGGRLPLLDARDG